jgi:cysteinyl-tRNA synthetase
LDLFGLGGLAERAQAPAEIAALATARAEARAAGDYPEADRLRGEIEAAGWDVRDVAGGFELVPR